MLHADETTLQVLREPGISAEVTSYLWLYRTGRDADPVVIYDYRRTRGGEHPRDFLAGFNGYLHVDGYAGYHKVKDVTLVGCWAHARRKDDEALKAAPEAKGNLDTVAAQGLAYCNQLFAMERERKEATLEESAGRAKPSGAGCVLCLIGRKHGRFANTLRGAAASAAMYSVIETAKENGLHPFRYLTYRFELLPQLADLRESEAFAPFMPWSSHLPDSCRMN